MSKRDANCGRCGRTVVEARPTGVGKRRDDPSFQPLRLNFPGVDTELRQIAPDVWRLSCWHCGRSEVLHVRIVGYTVEAARKEDAA